METKERRCKICGTILNQYNPSPNRCHLHLKLELLFGKEPPRNIRRRITSDPKLLEPKLTESFRSRIVQPDEEFLNSLEEVPKPERILRVVAAAYGFDPEVIKGRKRDMHVAWARYVAVYLFLTEFNWPPPKEVAKWISSTRERVKYGVNQVKFRMKTEPSVMKAIEEIRLRCQ